MKKIKLISIIILILVALQKNYPCTGVVLVTAETTLYGGNEDYYPDYTPYVIIKPATDTQYGVWGLGFGSFMQTAVNEKGLCFDGFSTSRKTITNNNNKPSTDGNIIEKALRTCETVEQVMELLDQYYLSWMADCQLMFADKFGNSVIYEGDDKIYMEGKYQICTNFYQSNQTPGWRYQKAKQMLSNGNDYSVDLVKSILDETHQEGQVITHYSNIFDLKNGKIYIYKKYNYTEVMIVDLNDELAKGNTLVKLEDYFKMTGIKFKSSNVPDKFNLSQNYPNPFNPATTIEFSIPQASKVKLIVFDTIGNTVTTLVNKEMNAGYHQINWNACRLSSGIYFYRIRVRDFTKTKKLILIK